MSGETHSPVCVDMGCTRHRGKEHSGKVDDCRTCLLVTCLADADPDYRPGRGGGK